LGGAGDIDIGAGNINYLARASVVNTSGGQGGKDLEALAGLTIPVRLSGPFDAVKYRIDYGSIATDAVKQKVEQKIKESLKDGVQDKLRNLFKR
jgi:AsmA protein